ncbi:uncharacterized protein LOC8263302 [Ricinus communis]|uniref:uncharacterized protein LOC8263302 n=1 Tax=Ricinus communis TaxID=3988 RepID=UPI00201AD954|nr:uncharacterized protein LOC8263302 [Ricinus communis]
MSNPIIAPRKKISPPRNTWRGWFRYFHYDETKDSPNEARNVLLVVMALIAAVTFQSGVNPPGGVWQDNDGHHAGRAIYAFQPHTFYVFLVSSTLALSTLLLVIVSLTYRFPLHLEIWVATASMIVTYASAIFAVTPRENVKVCYILIITALPLIMRILIQMLRQLKSEANEPVTEVDEG